MSTSEKRLGDDQQLTLLAVARLGDRAFGRAIRDELERVAGKTVSISTVYVTLVRLEERGLVESIRDEELVAKRGGKARRYFSLTPAAWEALHSARSTMNRMWRGLEDTGA